MGALIAILALVFITGLCIGSFLNVVILRTLSEESIVFPASKCPKCQTPLKMVAQYSGFIIYTFKRKMRFLQRAYQYSISNN